jgi:hypothetical protein
MIDEFSQIDNSLTMPISFPTLPIHGSAHGDSLHYAIYPVYPDANLKNILDYTLDLMSTWTDNYIWNLDPFTLNLDSSTPKLHGLMDMGEDSAVSLDEWVVLGVLWQVSKRFPNVIIRQDSRYSSLMVVFKMQMESLC